MICVKKANGTLAVFQFGIRRKMGSSFRTGNVEGGTVIVEWRTLNDE